MRIAHEFRRFDWRKFLQGVKARQLEEWIAYYEAEARGDDRQDILTSLLLHQHASEDTTLADIVKAVSRIVRPAIDDDDKADRRKQVKKERARRTKRKMRQQLALAKAMTDGGEQHRQMERPSNG